MGGRRSRRVCWTQARTHACLPTHIQDADKTYRPAGQKSKLLISSEYVNTYGDSDAISFQLVFAAPSCGNNSLKCLLLCCHLNTLWR